MLQALLAEMIALLGRGLPFIQCVVVENRVAAHLKAGASMLVHAGRDAIRHAGRRLRRSGRSNDRACTGPAATRRPKLHLDFLSRRLRLGCDGLICGGRMTILADPLEGRIPSDPLQPPIISNRCSQIATL